MMVFNGFFDCASVFTKSVAAMSFSLSYVLYLASAALHHMSSKMSKRCDVVFVIVDIVSL